MEDTTHWTTVPHFSPEENFDMLRHMHTEGGSEAEYLLDAYGMMSQSHGDAGDADDTPGVNHGSCFANSTSSIPSGESTKTTSSPSPSSDSPRDSLFDGEEGDEVTCTDPIIPVDYSEDRKNHWRRAGYHDHEIYPWASERGKYEYLVPKARQPAENAAWREAYQELKGQTPPDPIPYHVPRFWAPAQCPENPAYVCKVFAARSGQLLQPDQEGRLWYPEWHHRCRPHRESSEPSEPPEWRPYQWAKIPCECWHCVAHPDLPWSEVRAYRMNEIFKKHRYDTY
ncbi:hypothetical protein PG984_013138 [Apiospora sp. TS-2023a]